MIDSSESCSRVPAGSPGQEAGLVAVGYHPGGGIISCVVFVVGSGSSIGMVASSSGNGTGNGADNEQAYSLQWQVGLLD